MTIIIIIIIIIQDMFHEVVAPLDIFYFRQHHFDLKLTNEE